MLSPCQLRNIIYRTIYPLRLRISLPSPVPNRLFQGTAEKAILQLSPLTLQRRSNDFVASRPVLYVIEGSGDMVEVSQASLLLEPDVNSSEYEETLVTLTKFLQRPSAPERFGLDPCPAFCLVRLGHKRLKAVHNGTHFQELLFLRKRGRQHVAQE